MAEEFISVKDLAIEWGMERSNALKYIKKEIEEGRLNITLLKRRVPGSKGQPSSGVSGEDASILRSHRQEQGFLLEGELGQNRPVATDDGFFYLIQTEPTVDPGRIKLGFAQNIQTRLQTHKTSAPFAKVLKAWPCKRSWEPTLIEVLGQKGKLIQNEIYRFDNLEDIAAFADKVFDIFPDPNAKVTLADDSPLSVLSSSNTRRRSRERSSESMSGQS